MRFGTVLLATALFASQASVAAAQRMDLSVQCAINGSERACADVEVWNENDPETGQLYLFVQLANVQGWHGFADIPIVALNRWSIDDLELENFPGDGPASYESRIEGFSGFGVLTGNTFFCQFLVGCVPSHDHEPGDLVRIGPDGARFQIWDDIVFGHSPLWGCDGVPLDHFDFGPATCDGGLATWRVHLGFGTGLRLTKETNVHLSFGDGAAFTAGCTTGVDCVIVTPEPATIALMATGLAGIAAMRARRRAATRQRRRD